MKDAFELVHTNVCYVDAKSHVHAQYFVTFIDDATMHICIHTLKEKSHVFQCFKKFLFLSENLNDHKLRLP